MNRTVMTFLLLVGVVVAPIARADSFSFSGNFQADNDQTRFTFTTAGEGIFSVQTFSYGGGTDYNGNTVARGGFAPIISIFDQTGTLVALDYTGGTVGSPDPFAACQGRSIDSSTNACEDAAVYGSQANHLSPGTYSLVLTQSGNQANDAYLSYGFIYDAASCPYTDGCAAYSGEVSGLPGEMFVDPADHSTVRNSKFEISFTGSDLVSVQQVGGVSPVSEPGTLPLVMTGMLGVGALVKKRFVC